MPPISMNAAVAAFVVGIAFAFGSIIGSFVNACIYRLPRNISLVTRTRSFCPQCNATIEAQDNVPILSFLVLRGRCRSCRAPIPLRYLVVEILTASLFAALVYGDQVLNQGRVPWPMTAMRLFLLADLICLAFIDLELFVIPVLTTWPGIVLGIALAPFIPELHYTMHPWTGMPRLDAAIDAVHGCLLGAGSIWIVGLAGRVAFKKEAMGEGDVHLMGMVGAILGWKPVMEVFLIAPFFGSVIGIAQIAWRRRASRKAGTPEQPYKVVFKDDAGNVEEELEGNYIPYGPFLALAAVLVLFYEPLIRTALAWYVLGAGGAFEFRMPLVPWEELARRW